MSRSAEHDAVRAHRVRAKRKGSARKPACGTHGGLTLPKRKAVRTTNAVERRCREVRRRTRPVGTFQDKTSMDRILFAVFSHENKSQGVSTPFLLTQNN
jgi:Transposase, Mutator family